MFYFTSRFHDFFKLITALNEHYTYFRHEITWHGIGFLLLKSTWFPFSISTFSLKGLYLICNKDTVTHYETNGFIHEISLIICPKSGEECSDLECGQNGKLILMMLDARLIMCMTRLEDNMYHILYMYLKVQYRYIDEDSVSARDYRSFTQHNMYSKFKQYTNYMVT